ncbi:MAG: hypothetical protein WC460_05975 [Patescibacteria group bacterium]
MRKCAEKEEILKQIGKPFIKLTEKDWDRLFAHTQKCKICKMNRNEARKLLNSHLRDAINKFVIKHGLPELGILPLKKEQKKTQ